MLSKQSAPSIVLAVLLVVGLLADSSEATCYCDTAATRSILQDLFTATNGAKWTVSTGWFTNTLTVCNWHGISCTGPDITQLTLPDNNLVGTIPASLGELVYLTELDFSNNQLSGTVPSSFAGLSSLTTLNLFQNQLSGTLQASWGTSLSSLTSLGLFNNLFQGTLPAAWGSLISLTELYLSGNQLSGTLPPAWGAMKALLYLQLGWNRLSGTLPAQWGALPLIQLELASNSLSGCFDACALFPTASSDSGLNIVNNLFSGSLDLSCFATTPSVCSLLESTLFSKNRFCGSACGLPTCTANSSKACTFIFGTASNGPIIATVEVKSEAACCAACQGHARCIASEFYMSSGLCILQGSIGTETPKSNVTLMTLSTC